MIFVPEIPFPTTEFDDSHPLFIEARRPRKHYHPCWCGSGKKFKKCHRDRHTKDRPPLGQLLAEIDRVFWRKRGCMHPDASNETCSGGIIDAHSIQRKGPLAAIVDSTNHVATLAIDQSTHEFDVKRIGWRNASTFPGYCAAHDSALFRPLETQVFQEQHDLCVLQAFRNVCNELYRKVAFLETLRYQRDYVDLGQDRINQVTMQISLTNSIQNTERGIEDLVSTRDRFQACLDSPNFNDLCSRTFCFVGEVSVVGASILPVEYDFGGKSLMDISDLTLDAQVLSHSTLITDKGAAISFVWFKNETLAQEVVESFSLVANEDKGDIFVQYCFLNSENNYFSETWWTALDKDLQAQLRQYASLFHYDGGAFVANHDRLVDWKFD